MSAHVPTMTPQGRVTCLAGDMAPGSRFSFDQHNRDRRLREYVAEPCWLCGGHLDEDDYVVWAIRPGQRVKVCGYCVERGRDDSAGDAA